MANFNKKYNAKEVEPKIREFWEKNKIFKFDESTSKVVFSIDTPPPTISGKMHIGHAFSYTQTDFIARYKRMKGFEVFYPFGTDDNGLATEKLVQKEKKVNLRNIERDQAINICLDFLKEERPVFIQDFKNIGLSCDFNIKYSTIDDNSRKISQKTFLNLYKKGLVKQKEGPVAWDRVFQTAIAQAELEDVELKSSLNYIKAKFEQTSNTYLIYATTRPELLHGCVGLNVEAKGDYVKLKVNDEFWITGEKTYLEKYAKFDYQVVEKLKGENIIGERVIIPLSNIKIQITDDISVKADYGTGAVYYCTYGGIDCIEWMSRHPNIKPIKILDKAGKLTSLALEFEGLVASTQGRKKIIEKLEQENFLVMSEKIVHNVNVGERSGAEVEYIVSKQWYINYLDKKEYFFENAQRFNWKPEFMKHRLENWIKGLNWDWGFSRQRKFGVPIPVWYDKKGNVYLPKEEQLPVDPLKDRPLGVDSDVELIGEKDVLDTWFTSASSPELAISNIKSEKLKENLFPNKPFNLRPQAHDIINFWLFYTMAKTNLLYDINPFLDVAISGWVLDPRGKKMSKSKGNTIKPQDIVEKFSNDALRFSASSTKLGSDIPFQEKQVQTGIKIVNKLYNANKFACDLLEDFSKEDKFFDFDNLKSIDKWIISKIQNVIKVANRSFDSYDYSRAKFEFENFFMSDIADNYIEIVKKRLWNPQIFKQDTKSAQRAIYYVLFNCLKGLAPILPFITEEIYQIFYKEFQEVESIHKTDYPKFEEKFFDEDIIEKGDKFVEIVSFVRQFKSLNKVSMKNPISLIKVFCNTDLKNFIEDSIEDLKAVTCASNIEFEINDEFKIDIVE